jgi:hypothetical protein
MLPDKLAQVTSLPELIAEPTGARSMSFVGTHEYLAPEIIKGRETNSKLCLWILLSSLEKTLILHTDACYNEVGSLF